MYSYIFIVFLQKPYNFILKFMIYIWIEQQDRIN